MSASLGSEKPDGSRSATYRSGFSDEMSTYVWKNGLIEVRKVKIGHRNLLTTEVIEGLEVGERVIVTTPHLYRDGQRARLAESRK